MESSSSIFKELLPTLKQDGFKIYKNNLILSPINDLLRGFCFDKHDTRLYVHLFVQPLYVPMAYQNLSYGWRLKDERSGLEQFLIDDEHLNDSVIEIKRLVDENKKTLLATSNALSFYDTFLISDAQILANRTDKDIRFQEAFALTKSYLYPETTCSNVETFLQKWEMDSNKGSTWMQELKTNMLQLKKSCNDTIKIGEQFTQWVSYTKSRLRLIDSL